MSQTAVLRAPALACLVAAISFAAPALHGQTASLVADINPGLGESDSPSLPSHLFAAAGKVFFAASEPSTGEELWVTDGTSAGTRLLGDVSLGADGGSRPEPVAAVGHLVLFVARTGPAYELWRSDGTRAGTYRLRADVNPPGEGGWFVPFNGRLYFLTCVFAACELWGTDGTLQGTRPLQDDPPELPNGFTEIATAGGQLYFLASGPSSASLWTSDGTSAGTVRRTTLPLATSGLTAAGQRVFFLAGDNEVWTSDGTAAGTRRLVHFPGFNPFAQGRGLKPIGDRVYFVADDGVHGSEIWRSDGSAAGTQRLTELADPAPFDSTYALAHIEALGERVIFLANESGHGLRIWKSDGTPQSTVRLSDAPAGRTGLRRVGGKVLFTAIDSLGTGVLWTTDGTPSGTRPLTGVCPGSPGTCAPHSLLVPFAGGLFFVASVPGHGSAIWRTDGTAAGTRRFTDLGVTQPSSDLELAALGPRIFFSGADSTGSRQLWSSDGTLGGTRLAADVARRALGSAPVGLLAVGDRLFFTACRDETRQVWQTSGTPATTVQLTTGGADRSCGSGDRSLPLAAAAGSIFFLRDENDFDPRLWKTDGTPGGTVQLGGFTLPAESDQPAAMVAFQGLLFFTALAGSGQAEMWRTDGTASGTVAAFTLPAGVEVPSALTALGGELYFLARDADGINAWRSDGTPAGTRQLTTSRRSSHEPRFARLGSTVFFLGNDPESAGAETTIWKTDGTAAGTALSGLGGTDVTDLTAFGGALYFFATPDTFPRSRQLVRSDGTVAGTVVLHDFPPGDFATADPSFLTPAGSQLFFTIDDEVHGTELWRSDGTAAGTVLVRDVLPGADSSRPASLAAAGGKLYFSASDGVHGFELWESDGTEAGTRFVQDLAPEAESSFPGQAAATGNRLYWSADDGLFGRELWSLPLSGPTGCQLSATRLCLNGNRFQVEIEWRDFAGNTGAGTAVSLTSDTGAFWFFAPQNVEVIVKVIDGQAINQSFWVFYGALSNVEYTITVTDTQTGLTRRYFNPAGQFASVGDTGAF